MELLGKQTGAGRPQPVGTARTDPAIILLIQELKAQTLTLHCTADLAVIPRRALTNPGQPLL